MNSGNISVGMLVRIIDHPSFINEESCKYIGHIGIVIRECTYDNHPDYWDIEGIPADMYGFGSEVLEPIKPDSTPADEDFQEDLKRWLDKKVTA